METENKSDLSVNDDDEAVDYMDYKGFEQIGYHRITGSFYFNIIFAPLAIGYVFLIPLFVPYPESYGFYKVITTLFSSIFTLADLGLASALSRFIAEYRVKDAERTQQYIRFFIWFQAFTGLLQTTLISIWGLVLLEDSYLSYAPWFFCWISIIQYPGWLAVFKEALKGFQQYNKVTIITIANTIIQILTLLAFAQLGTWLGTRMPQIGGVMGGTIGMIIGYYIDDFSTLLISAYMFAKVAEPLGFTMRDVLRFDVDKDVIKESITFGVGVMIFNFSWQIIASIISLIYASSLPGYSTLVAAAEIIIPVVGLSAQVNLIHYPNVRPSVSEGYFNEKENYSRYIISNTFRTSGQFIGLITPIVIILTPDIFSQFLPDYYPLFQTAFIAALIHMTIFQFSHLMDEVLIGTGHNGWNITVTVLENLVLLIMTLIWIELDAGIFVLIWPRLIGTMVKQTVGWYVINKKVIRMKINIWQSFISTAMAGLVYFILFRILYEILVSYMAPIISLDIVLVLSLLIALFVIAGPFYFYFWGLFGGF